MQPKIIYIDNHLLVLEKPAGLLSQADRTGDIDLLQIGKAYIKETFDKPGRVFLGLVHRLDRPVSGVMVLARTSKSASRLTAQFRQRQVGKMYMAVVEGRCHGQGVLEHHLVKLQNRVKVVPSTEPDGRFARLQWTHIATSGSYSLIHISLETGRPHQIRVQLAAHGFPVLGDRKYGAQQPFIGRNIALHSYRLALVHPTKNEELIFTADAPKSWQGFFERERAHLCAPTP